MSTTPDHERLLGELTQRRTRAQAMGGPAKLAARREQGLLNARERVARLLPRLSTAEVIAWLATEYPRGLIAAGLRAVDESRITAERGPQ